MDTSVSTLDNLESLRLLKTAITSKTTAILSYMSRNKWHVAKVYLLDLDMDEHLDIVAAPTGDPQGPMFYLNSGDGTYSHLPNVFNIGTDNVFTFLDSDQDGFLDVLWSFGGVPNEAHYLVRALGCPVFLPFVCRNCSAGN